jgi:hypothetical protein
MIGTQRRRDFLKALYQFDGTRAPQGLHGNFY